MFILLSGTAPFYHEDTYKLFDLIEKGSFSFSAPAWDEVSETAKDLIVRLLVVNPDERLTQDQIRFHPWLAGEVEIPSRELHSSLEKMREWNSMRRNNVPDSHH